LDRIDQRDLPLNGAYQYAFSGAAPLYGERGLRIYVLDTGIMTSHQEFVDPDGYVRAKVGYDARPQDGQNGQDCHGHGTHVAATAGGKTVGVAKSAELIAVRITTQCLRGGSVDDGVKGIDWVAGNHGFSVGVMNLSWAVEDQWGNETTSYAVDNALYNAQWYGNLVGVAAAGNDNKDACYVSPAATARLAVGATNSSDSRAPFSNRGSCVDIFAPGEGILSAALDGGYRTDSGTSMAAPHVSGVLAQMVEQDPFITGTSAAQAVLNRSTAGKVQNAGSGSPNRLVFSN
jgi:subtilisin family serine protease